MARKSLLGLFLAFLVVFSLPSRAEDPRSAWAFYEIRLSELARIAFSQLLQVSFVADDAFINDQRKVSIDLKADKGGRARELLIALIRQYGYVVTDDAGLLVIRKPTDEDKGNGYALYKPRFRSVAYLNDILGLQGSRSIRPPDGQRPQSPQQESQNTPNALLDRNTDVLYIKGTDIERKRILAALQMIDVPHDQVELYAVVYEFQTSSKDGTAFGALLSLFKDRLSFGLGSVAQLDGATGQARIATKSLQAVISAISEDQRFRLVSSPQLRVRSGATARFSVGAQSDSPLA
jgi:type II secretory pathway component GspD/PulD (secretin)